MKFIKLGIISIVILFSIITCIGLLLPSAVRVTRNITIHASQDTLQHFISDVKYWKLWLAGVKDSPIVFLSAKTVGTGTVALINGQQVAITKATKNSIETLWKSSNGYHQRGIFQLAEDTAAHNTNINWYFEQKVNWYPWQRLSTLSNDKLLGPGMEQSLDNLKAVAEAINQ